MSAKQTALGSWPDPEGGERSKPRQDYQPRPKLSTVFGGDGAAMPEPQRFRKGHDLEDRVYGWLKQRPAVDGVERSGVEHRFGETFLKILRRVRTIDTAKLCASPDFVVITRTGRVIYFECKRSLSVERLAFESYLDTDRVHPVWLVCEHQGVCYLGRASRIRFIDSQRYVSQFDTPFRIGEGDWIEPNRRGPGFSGAPFKIIDLSSMTPISLEVRA
jgi:hypothetical protein